jgi:hypothetical protein
MNTTHYLAAAGFMLVTIVYFVILLNVLFRGASSAPWSDDTKHKFKRNWIAGILIWAAFVTTWSASGKMSDFSVFPLNFAPILAIPIIAVFVLTFSRSMTTVLQQIPAHKIVRLQSFRFFVEILLWLLFIGNELPVQMTFEGYNFDILAGITAVPVAWLISRGNFSKRLIAGWNIACLLLLINIVTIAILSTPTPVRVFMNEPANYIVAEFPISFLPGFLVPLALMLHAFSLRQVAVSSQGSIKASTV